MSLKDKLNQLDDMFRFGEGQTVSQGLMALESSGEELVEMKKAVTNQDSKVILLAKGSDMLAKEVQGLREEVRLASRPGEIAKKVVKKKS